MFATLPYCCFCYCCRRRCFCCCCCLCVTQSYGSGHDRSAHFSTVIAIGNSRLPPPPPVLLYPLAARWPGRLANGHNAAAGRVHRKLCCKWLCCCWFVQYLSRREEARQVKWSRVRVMSSFRLFECCRRRYYYYCYSSQKSTLLA